jgi:hypothetical protein
MAGYQGYRGYAGYGTPEQIARQREVALALLANRPMAPRNVGEGLASLGAAIGGRLAMDRVARGEAAGRESASKAFGALFGGAGASTGTGGGGSSYRNAIAGLESGGKYSAVGPTHPKLGRALGKY